MYRVSKPRINGPEQQILQHLDDVMSIEQALPKPKVLKSCIRCRKHKTKCDAFDMAPNGCSSCQKKGVHCKIDYVLPPQRSDNLKNILSQVNDIKHHYERLEQTYGQIFGSLGIEVPSYESWRESKLYNGNMSPEDEDQPREPFCLIKLSDDSFVSLNMINSQQLMINNTIINVADLEDKLGSFVKRLNHLYTTLAPESTLSCMSLNYESDTQSMTSSSSESSVASPRSFTHTHSPSHTASLSQDTLTWFDIDFHVSELFRVNKLLLVLLVAYYYPSQSISPTYTVLLSDYLNSFYQIIETQNKSLNSSTYSNHLLNTIIPGCSIFDKAQLRELVDAEVFNSDVYLKRLTQILFINVLLFGIDDNLNIMNEFVRFVELSINLNRKKINFDKSRDLRFIESFTRVLNVFTGDSPDPQLHIAASKRRSVSKEYETFMELLKMDSAMTTQGVAPDGEVTNIQELKKEFKRFLDTWESYTSLHNPHDNIFIDHFILELVLVNCLSLINEGFQEFNTILVEFLSKHNLTTENTNVTQLINSFRSDDAISFESLNLSCEKMAHVAWNVASKRRNVLDLKMNDIQVILENVDWKKESTDEVLKKIGVI